MRRWPVILSAMAICTTTATAVAGTANAGNDNDPYTLSNGHAQAGQISGVVPAQDSNAAHGHGGGGGGPGPNLIYHGGPVRHGTSVEAIFVGSAWNTDTTFAADKMTGLDKLYGGLSNTNGYALTNHEYTDSIGNVDPSVSYQGHVVDPNNTLTGDPGGAGVAAEVVNAIGTPNAGWYYPVYITGARGNAGYCAWHDTASYTNKGTTVNFQIGFFFNLDGDPGCDPQASGSLGHSQGLNALANVTGHEYSEMVTDPQLTAWWDAAQNENADKCAWTFGSLPLSIGGTSWKIQGNWSNAAYNAGRGYGTKRNKVIGCIDGTNA